jgi:IMP dehydrogenase
MLPVEIPEGLTFDDILLLPGESDFMPKDANVSTYVTRTIRLNTPLVSAAMDTVTEARTAIAMAQTGGIGVIHRNLGIPAQAAEVAKVKKYESGVIINPITIAPDITIAQAREIMDRSHISGLPVTKDDKLVGILTNRDLRFEKRLDRMVSEVMTKENLVTAWPGISREEAEEILHTHRIEKLLVVDEDMHLKGLITVKDIEKTSQHPNACKDEYGRLRVAAAIGTGDDREARTESVIEAGADMVILDTAHGHTTSVVETVRSLKQNFRGLEVVAGNVATAEGAQALIEAGADGIKVGMGPASICTTRVVSGVGVPQLTAVVDTVRVAERAGVPVISDGGIRFSGDIVKALAAGAQAVMIGSLFAGTEESPGETILYQGRSYKQYRGMGSLEAMREREGSRNRYFQDAEESAGKLVPEGIEGRVPYKGPLSVVVDQLVGGLKAGMGYTGCRNLEELRTKVKFVRVSPAGLRENHVHDVIITKEAPNYQLE